MGGTAPADRPELADVATALSEFRIATNEPLPTPSSRLKERLDGGWPVSPEGTKLVVVRPRAGGRRTIAGWVAGASILAKIALGSTVAVAAVTTAGAVGVLPGGAQQVFDSAVNFVLPGTPRDAELVTTPVPVPTAETRPDDIATPTPDATVVPDSTLTPEAESTPGSSNGNGTPGTSNGTPGTDYGNGNGTPETSNGNGTPGVPNPNSEKEKVEKETKDKSGDSVPLTSLGDSVADATTVSVSGT